MMAGTRITAVKKQWGKTVVSSCLTDTIYTGGTLLRSWMFLANFTSIWCKNFYTS